MIKFFFLIPIALLMAGCGMVPPVVNDVAEVVRDSWFSAAESNVIPAVVDAVVSPTWNNLNTAISAAVATVAGFAGLRYGKKRRKK